MPDVDVRIRRAQGLDDYLACVALQKEVWGYSELEDIAAQPMLMIGDRFGGGWYRAKILGAWDRERRREEYFEQVAFGIDQQWWPMTAETRERIRKQHGM